MANVLVVDDERSIRVTVETFLRREGHTVWTAEDADAALARLAEGGIDIVVSDVILPRVTGVELLRQIHGMSPDVQVIMMTGQPTIDTAAEAVRQGAFDYLRKPVTRNLIVRTVANAAELKSAADEKRPLQQENRQTPPSTRPVAPDTRVPSRATMCC